MKQRREMLEKLTTSGKADAFAWYALALEYRREKRFDDALGTFGKLRKLHPDYLPMYLMAGQILLGEARPEDARDWLEAGISLARDSADPKTLSELEEALSECSG